MKLDLNMRGALWAGACGAGGLVGYSFGSRFGALSLHTWQAFLCVRLVLGGLLPLAFAIPLALSLWRLRSWSELIAVLLFSAGVTGTTYPALADLRAGPTVETVEVVKSAMVSAPRYSGNCCANWDAQLKDGRVFRYDDLAADHALRGRVRVMYLDHIGVILTVWPSAH